MNQCVFSRKQAEDSRGCIARKGKEDSHGDKLENQHIGLWKGVLLVIKYFICVIINSELSVSASRCLI